MTSTIFSSKTFPTFYKWAFKRNKAVMVIFSVLLGLGVILDLYAMTQIPRFGYGYTSDSLNDEFGEIGAVTIIIFQIGAIFFTFVSSLLTFSFLHNKRSVDMFGSAPTTRGTMFASHLLGGISSVAAPFITGCLIVMGFTARTGEYFKFDLIMVALGVLGILAAYSFTALIAYCCGTVIDTAIVTIGVNAICGGAVALFWGMCSEMIPGLEFESIIYSPILPIFSPYAFCFFGDFYFFSEEKSAFFSIIIWNVIFIAGITACALFAAIKRKAEVSQSEFAVKWLPMAIKAGASVVAGGFIGCIAALTSDLGLGNMAVFALWYVIIGAVAFFILHVIFSRGVKRHLLPSLIVYAVTTVAAVGFVFILSTGLGIDTYVPVAQNVSTVSFNYEDYKDPENVKIITQIHKLVAEGTRKEEGFPYYLGNDSQDYYIYEDINSDDPEICYDDGDYPITVGTDDVPLTSRSSDSSRNVEDFSNNYPLTYMTSFNFSYSKKVGFKTVRSYYIANYSYDDKELNYDYDAIEELLQQLYSSTEYKHLRNEIIWDDELRSRYSLALNETPELNFMQYVPFSNDDYYYGYSTSSYQNVGSVKLPTGENFYENLFVALRKDMDADTEYYKTVTSHNSALLDNYLTLTVAYTRKEKDQSYYGMFDDYEPYSQYIDVVIPLSYKNTIDYLNSRGIDTDYRYMDQSYVFNWPLDYINSSSDAYNISYPQFGQKGDVESLKQLVEDITPQLEYMSIIRMKTKYDGNVIDWVEAHEKEFSEKALEIAIRDYTGWKDNPKYISSTYTNEFTLNNGYNGEYFYLADQIITDLDAQCVSIAEEINEDAAPAELPNGSDKAA